MVRAATPVRLPSVLPASALAIAAILASGCVDPFPGEPEDYDHRAVIRWTDHGIPHILADDIPSAMYGQGYAFARLNGCILADQIVKVRSERAKYFGPGEEGENVNSDFAHLHMRIMALAEEALEEQREDIRASIDAYTRGYNDFVRTRGDELPCGGEDWLQPIDALDLMGHYIELGTLGSGRQLKDFLADAAPPPAGLELDPNEPKRPPLPSFKEQKIGSNGWGIGRDRSESGGGMLLANPHFPWQGELKLYESHLRVPGELDVYGAGLMGVLGVLIGFNEGVSWTHTVSAGNRFTMYALTLVPGDPTSYMYDGQVRAMEPTTYTIEVMDEDGGLTERSRTLWRSHYGPIIEAAPFFWSTDLVLTFRDANEQNGELIQQFSDMNRADTMDEFQSAHALTQGIPWVNTISTSAEGRAWYTDSCPTPNLSQEAIDLWLERRGSELVAQGLWEGLGVVALDGSDSTFEWVEESGAREPGLVPFSKMPQLERTDFVFNANDSYWSSNPDQLLTGFSPLHGEEGTPRTPRTRMNAFVLTEMGEGTASGADGRFNPEELRLAALSNRGSMAELLRDQVIGRCQDAGDVTFNVFDAIEGQEITATVDVTEACEVLANWDRRLDLDSVGAVVWREFIFDFDSSQTQVAGQLFAEDFDATDPFGTPHTLAAAPEEGDDPVLVALARGVWRLQKAGLSVDTPLGEAQFTKKFTTRERGEDDFERIPIHGGGRAEGVTNLIQYSSFKTTLEPDLPRGSLIYGPSALTDEGYVVNYGTSFIMTSHFAEDGPEAWAFVTYSQSDDPESPYHADQTRRFSDKQWRKVLFTEEDIAADEALQVEVIFAE